MGGPTDKFDIDLEVELEALDQVIDEPLEELPGRHFSGGRRPETHALRRRKFREKDRTAGIAGAHIMERLDRLFEGGLFRWGEAPVKSGGAVHTVLPVKGGQPCDGGEVQRLVHVDAFLMGVVHPFCWYSIFYELH